WPGALGQSTSYLRYLSNVRYSEYCGPDCSWLPYPVGIKNFSCGCREFLATIQNACYQVVKPSLQLSGECRFQSMILWIQQRIWFMLAETWSPRRSEGTNVIPGKLNMRALKYGLISLASSGLIFSSRAAPAIPPRAN